MRSVRGIRLAHERPPFFGRTTCSPGCNPASTSQSFADLAPKLHAAPAYMPVIRDFDHVELADADDGGLRHDDDVLVLDGDEDATEHPGINPRRAWPCYLDRERSTGGLSFGHDLTDLRLALVIQRFDAGRQPITDLGAARRATRGRWQRVAAGSGRTWS